MKKLKQKKNKEKKIDGTTPTDQNLLYGEWQTQPYTPEVAIDGIVPKILLEMYIYLSEICYP